MLNTKTFEAVAADLAAIDAAASARRLAELENERRQLIKAREEGRARAMALTRKIRDLETSGPDRTGAADALLAGEVIQSSLASAETVRGERDAITAGMTELRRREEAVTAAIRRERESATAMLRSAVVPAVSALEEEFRELLGRLATAYAGAKAVQLTCHSGEAANLVHHVEQALAKLCLTPLLERSPIEVPETIHRMLAAGQQALDVTGDRIPADIRAPDVMPLEVFHIEPSRPTRSTEPRGMRGFRRTA